MRLISSAICKIPGKLNTTSGKRSKLKLTKSGYIQSKIKLRRLFTRVQEIFTSKQNK